MAIQPDSGRWLGDVVVPQRVSLRSSRLASAGVDSRQRLPLVVLRASKPPPVLGDPLPLGKHERFGNRRKRLITISRMWDPRHRQLRTSRRSAHARPWERGPRRDRARRARGAHDQHRWLDRRPGVCEASGPGGGRDRPCSDAPQATPRSAAFVERQQAAISPPSSKSRTAMLRICSSSVASVSERAVKNARTTHEAHRQCFDSGASRVQHVEQGRWVGDP